MKEKGQSVIDFIWDVFDEIAPDDKLMKKEMFWGAYGDRRYRYLIEEAIKRIDNNPNEVTVISLQVFPPRFDNHQEQIHDDRRLLVVINENDLTANDPHQTTLIYYEPLDATSGEHNTGCFFAGKTDEIVKLLLYNFKFEQAELTFANFHYLAAQIVNRHR